MNGIRAHRWAWRWRTVWRRVASTAAPAASTRPTPRRPTCWSDAAIGSSKRELCCPNSDGMGLPDNIPEANYRAIFWFWNIFTIFLIRTELDADADPYQRPVGSRAV